MSDVELLSPERQLLDLMLAPQGPRGWPDLQPIVESAKGAYFVLHRCPDGDPVSALTDVFPQLVRSLGLDSVAVRREYIGRVRGKIEWGATVRARCADEQNPQRFVCREAERHTDTPENQLVVWLLERLGEAMRELPVVIRDGSSRHGVAGDRFASIAPQLDALTTALHQLAAHPHLRDVTRPAEIGELHLECAHRARHEGYGLAASLAERWHQLHQTSGPRGLVELSRFSILVPAPRPDADPWLDLAARLLLEH